MVEKQTIATIGLTAVILTLTAAAVGRTPSSPILGAVTPIIIPTLLTWCLLMILAYGRRIVDMLAAFLLARPLKEDRRTQSLLATFLAWVIVMALAVVIIRPEIARVLADVFQQTLKVLSSTLSVFRQATQAGVESGSSASNVVLYYYTILVFGVIIIGCFSLFFGAFRRVYTEVQVVSGGQEVREGVCGVVRETRKKLEARERYHETILECYRQMCKVLSAKGHSIQPAQTAREFAESVSGKLDLGTESVEGMTFLFEEARYSDHEIGDEKRGLALGYLHSLEHALVNEGAKS